MDMSQTRTNHLSVFGEECCVVSKVDSASDNVTAVKYWAKRSAYVLACKTPAIVAMVSPRFWLPANGP